MGTQQNSYCLVAATELAEWLERDPDCYWTVDGDRKLGGKVSFPCPGDELAAALRKIDQPLEVLDIEGSHAPGKHVPASELDGFVEKEELDTRVLQFRWKGSEIEWILVEDEETSESVKREAEAQSE